MTTEEIIITDTEIIIVKKRIIKRELNPSLKRKQLIVSNVGDPLKEPRNHAHCFKAQCNRYGITEGDYYRWKEEIKQHWDEVIRKRYEEDGDGINKRI